MFKKKLIQVSVEPYQWDEYGTGACNYVVVGTFQQNFFWKWHWTEKEILSGPYRSKRDAKMAKNMVELNHGLK